MTSSRQPTKARARTGKAGTPSPRSPRRRTGWGLAAAGVVLGLLAGEVAVRSLGLGRPPQARTTEPADVLPFREIPEGLYVYESGIRFAHVYDPAFDERGYFAASGGRIDYRINALGLRGSEFDPEPAPGVKRVLLVGDSFTFGEGVREEDTLALRLGGELGSGFEVLNGGVQGYGFGQEALYISLAVPGLQPDAVVLGFYMNDLLPFAATVEQQGAWTDAGTNLTSLGRISALWGLVERRSGAARRWRRHVEALEESFAGPLWEAFRAELPRLQDYAERDGFELMALVFPLLEDFREPPLAAERRQVLAAFAEAGIEAVDLLPLFREAAGDARELWVHPTDPHPNERAHAVVAQHLAPLLRARFADAEDAGEGSVLAAPTPEPPED